MQESKNMKVESKINFKYSSKTHELYFDRRAYWNVKIV